MRPQRLVSWAGQQQVREPRPLGDPECADVDVGQACIPWAGRHRSEPHWMDGSGQRCRQVGRHRDAQAREDALEVVRGRVVRHVHVQPCPHPPMLRFQLGSRLQPLHHPVPVRPAHVQLGVRLGRATTRRQLALQQRGGSLWRSRA